MDARDRAWLGRARHGVARPERGKDQGPSESMRGTGQGQARPGQAGRGGSKARIMARLGRAGHGGARARRGSRTNVRRGTWQGRAWRGWAGLGGSKARIMDRRSGSEGRGRAGPGQAWRGAAGARRGTGRGGAGRGRARLGESKARIKDRRNGREVRGWARQDWARLEQGEDHGPAEWERGTGPGAAWLGAAGLGGSKARIMDGREARDAAGRGVACHGRAGQEQGKDQGRESA
jgi:hypothetical protein